MNPKIKGTRYVLAVKDLQKSGEFYINQLGFTTVWKIGSWHFLIRDECKIMLGECPEDLSADEIGCHSYFGYVEISKIDELLTEYKARGVEILSDIENKPWGQREFSIQTIDGHRITFGESIY